MNCLVPAILNLQIQAGKIVDDAHRIARERGGNIISIIKELVNDLKKKLIFLLKKNPWCPIYICRHVRRFLNSSKGIFSCSERLNNFGGSYDQLYGSYYSCCQAQCYRI
jgi:hypothetical protein